jgi:phospholipid/cholesterol/gamma-HCH transport system substrate-binding protein
MRRPVGWMVAVAVTVSGCANATLRDVPMPKVVSGSTYEVTAVFDNVLGLPEQASVKWDGATIGEVGTITTADYAARVGLQISDKFRLPSDVQAEIRFGSPMGEAFVELTDPPGGPTSTLPEGGVIELRRTSSAPSIGNLLSATSTLVTGGSYADMKVIITELNTALRGNGPGIRRLIDELDGMVTRLNEHTADFDAALDSMQRFSSGLADDRELVGESLDTFEPAIETLSHQRTEILDLMTQLRKVSATATTTIAQTRESMLSVLADLEPVLDTLTENEATFRQIMAGIRDFAKATTSAIFGLFLNFDLTTLFDPDALLGSLPNPAASVPAATSARKSAADRKTPEQAEPRDLPSSVTGTVKGLLDGLTGSLTGPLKLGSR